MWTHGGFCVAVFDVGFDLRRRTTCPLAFVPQQRWDTELHTSISETLSYFYEVKSDSHRVMWPLQRA